MKFLKKSKKLIIGIIIGLIVGSVVSVYAAYSYFAEDVSYASSNGTEISVQEALDQLYARQNSLSIPIPIHADFTGCYADVNDDGTVDGVIFIDLAKGASGQWGNSNGAYQYSAVTSGLRSYKISSSYTGNYGTNPVIAPNGTSGKARFYVMALSDYGNWSNAYLTTQKVGSVTFRLPSREEWSAFAGQLGTSGLSWWYWLSRENNTMWFAWIDKGFLSTGTEGGDGYVRLCATF